MANKLLSSLDSITALGGYLPAPVARLFRYATAAGIASAVEITFLWFLTGFIGIFYLFSAFLAFILGTTLNYNINRFWGFRGTKRRFTKGLALFITFGTIGLVLTLALLALFVEVFHIHYLIARIIVLFIVGMWNFSMNSYVTFRQSLLK